jgi:hypothetical protein
MYPFHQHPREGRQKKEVKKKRYGGTGDLGKFKKKEVSNNNLYITADVRQNINVVPIIPGDFQMLC